MHVFIARVLTLDDGPFSEKCPFYPNEESVRTRAPRRTPDYRRYGRRVDRNEKGVHKFSAANVESVFVYGVLLSIRRW